jgi:hypothetical protein
MNPDSPNNGPPTHLNHLSNQTSGSLYHFYRTFSLFHQVLHALVLIHMPSDHTLVVLFENELVLEIPLKHDEIYQFTYNPEFPGPLVHIF